MDSFYGSVPRAVWYSEKLSFQSFFVELSWSRKDKTTFSLNRRAGLDFGFGPWKSDCGASKRHQACWSCSDRSCPARKTTSSLRSFGGSCLEQNFYTPSRTLLRTYIRRMSAPHGFAQSIFFSEKGKKYLEIILFGKPILGWKANKCGEA